MHLYLKTKHQHFQSTSQTYLCLETSKVGMAEGTVTLLKNEETEVQPCQSSQGHTQVVTKPRLNLGPQILSPMAF